MPPRKGGREGEPAPWGPVRLVLFGAGMFVLGWVLGLSTALSYLNQQPYARPMHNKFTATTGTGEGINGQGYLKTGNGGGSGEADPVQDQATLTPPSGAPNGTVPGAGAEGGASEGGSRIKDSGQLSTYKYPKPPCRPIHGAIGSSTSPLLKHFVSPGGSSSNNSRAHTTCTVYRFLPFLRRVPQGKGVAAEVGSFDGKNVAKLAYASKKVYSYEATPAKGNILRNHYRKAKVASKVEFFSAAVGDKMGNATLFLPFGKPSQQDSLGNQEQWAGSAKTRKVEVPMVTLSETIREHVNLLWIDTQGAEARVLKGAQGLIDRHGVDLLKVEFWPEGLRMAGSDPEQFLQQLWDMGFSCVDCMAMVSPKPPLEPKNFGNFVATFGSWRPKGMKGIHGQFTDLVCQHKASTLCL